MRLFSRRIFLMGVASIGGGFALGYVTTPNPSEDDGSTITCPFLAMNPPDTTNVWTFARGCEENGMAYAMALFVCAQVTYYQKGLLAVLRHEAPNIYRLREVPGISHEDRYALYLSELRALAAEMQNNEKLTLQNLVELKEWVAKQVGVEISEASRIETALLFVRSGGDMNDWTVSTEDVFLLLAGHRPSSEGLVTVSKLNRATEASKWSGI